MNFPDFFTDMDTIFLTIFSILPGYFLDENRDFFFIYDKKKEVPWPHYFFQDFPWLSSPVRTLITDTLDLGHPWLDIENHIPGIVLDIQLCNRFRNQWPSKNQINQVREKILDMNIFKCPYIKKKKKKKKTWDSQQMNRLHVFHVFYGLISKH